MIRLLAECVTVDTCKRTNTISVNDLSLVWFRNDLRLKANPALNSAAQSGQRVICLYILETDGKVREHGAAKKWWLNKSIAALSSDLKKLGGQLVLRKTDGRPEHEFISDFCREHKISRAFWNRRYAGAEIAVDTAVKKRLTDDGITVSSFNGSLLAEPWTLSTKSGAPYRVFTPFWNALKQSFSPEHPNFAPDIKFAEEKESDDLTSWGLHPSKPDWSSGLEQEWTPGEIGAQEQLNRFFESGLPGYAEKRDRPDLPNTSRLSAHLSFGEIYIHDVWSQTLEHIRKNPSLESDGWAFLRELAWRDFSYSLLYQSKDLSDQNWNPKFDGFEWTADLTLLENWKRGKTGYPIVDAGMRELWETGWMHNRVRMIVASFLIKHLMIDWRVGEDWFWDTLVDADIANNPASWQWVAGSGADASPYFRIFNPITQGSKFDPKGDYIRRWVPEIASLPDKYLFEPWTTPKDVQKAKDVVLGQDYPLPVVDHATARKRALAAYERLSA